MKLKETTKTKNRNGDDDGPRYEEKIVLYVRLCL